MSRPAQGSYIIYNRVLSPSGQILAITFNGQNNTLTVTPKTNAATQIFNLANFDTKTMSVVPKSATNLQVGWGGSGATPMPPGNYVWTILGSASGFTIQDGGATQNWHIDQGAANANVAIGADQGSERYRWVLELVN